MKIRKKVTPAKAAANRNNAKHSTGPTTKPGKDRASRNAITHGIYARDMLLPCERKEEFDQLADDMIRDHDPVVAREFHRVEKLIWHQWRQRRLRRAENGEIAKLLADHQPAAEIAASTHIPQYNQAVKALNLLEQTEEQIRSDGRVSADNLVSIRKLPYFEEVKCFLQLVERVQPAKPGDDIRIGPETTAAEAASGEPTDATNDAPSEAKQEFAHVLLDALALMKQSISLEKLYRLENMGRRSEAKRSVCLVPQEAELNRLMRWEDHLSRHHDGDELALERMQRQRRGKKVPTPSARG